MKTTKNRTIRLFRCSNVVRAARSKILAALCLWITSLAGIITLRNQIVSASGISLLILITHLLDRRTRRTMEFFGVGIKYVGAFNILGRRIRLFGLLRWLCLLGAGE